MSPEKQEKLLRFLDENTAGCRRRGAALAADGRDDEAKFEKIRGNVYDIFKTVLLAGDKAGSAEVFWRNLEDIPARWQAAYQQAEAHGDHTAAHIERIKLAAAADIRAAAGQREEEGI